MSTINGLSLQARIDECVGEIEERNEVRQVVSHHMAVCYEQLEKIQDKPTTLDTAADIVDSLPLELSLIVGNYLRKAAGFFRSINNLAEAVENARSQ